MKEGMEGWAWEGLGGMGARWGEHMDGGTIDGITILNRIRRIISPPPVTQIQNFGSPSLYRYWPYLSPVCFCLGIWKSTTFDQRAL